MSALHMQAVYAERIRIIPISLCARARTGELTRFCIMYTLRALVSIFPSPIHPSTPSMCADVQTWRLFERTHTHTCVVRVQNLRERANIMRAHAKL